ncbi:MAG: glycosyltransferase family 2 protein [Cyclobacteriaceae bacterium]
MESIAVIIPTKNRKELLDITIQNIFSQTIRPNELIIVDDHSTDGTLDFFRSKYGEDVILLKNVGVGPGAARNTGLASTKCEFVKFFDSDDLMSLNSLEVQMKSLIASNADMVYTPYVHAKYENRQWQQQDVVKQYFPIPQKMTLRECMSYGFFTVIPAMMFRRNFLLKVGKWREDILAYEDWDYLWRIGGLVDHPNHTNDCLMIYRIHGDQTTDNQSSDIKRDGDKIRVMYDLLSDLPNNTISRFLTECEFHKTKSLLDKDYKISMLHQLGILWKRIRNKIERKRTGTHWERMHGPSKSIVLTDYFNDLII